MLVTTQSNRRNRNAALILSAVVALLFLVAGFFKPWLWGGLLLAPLVYWLARRQTLRRMQVMKQPLPPEWEGHLISYVEFYRVLDDPGKERFRNLAKVFLDEVLITGVRTDVDDVNACSGRRQRSDSDLRIRRLGVRPTWRGVDLSQCIRLGVPNR